MKIKDLPLHSKKKISVLLHLLFLLFALVGVSVIILNPHYGEGIRWLATETYEDTAVFTKQLKTDIDDIFNYVNYKEVFETNGKLDFSKPMVTVTDGPGRSKTYSLDEMIRHAKSKGLYLNERFKISGPVAISGDEEEPVHVERFYYDPNIEYSEPGDYFSTMDELSEDILTHLGNYYSFYYKFIQNPSNLEFRVFYKNTEADYRLYTNTEKESINLFKSMGKFLYVSGDSVIVENNLTSVPRNITTLLETNNPYNNSNYYMVVAVNTSYPHPDSYAREAAGYRHQRTLYIIGIICLIVGVLGCVSTIYYLILVSGFKNTGDTEIRLHSFDQMSTENFLLLCLTAAFCALFIGEQVGYRFLHLFLDREQWYYAERLVRMVIVYAVFMTGAFSLLRRYKARTLWDNSLMKKVAASVTLYLDHRSFSKRLGICYLLFLSFNVVIVASSAFLFSNSDGLAAKILLAILIILLAGADFWAFHQLYKNAIQNDKINEAVLKISSGDTGYKIDTTGFFGKEKELAETINHISSGLETALSEKVKSERLKADLITNVSHDIKTPLTSIINYVGLIKRENIQNEKIKGYLEVLDQKSQRLKTLTEDLVEASKASSGNLKLEISDIDFVELIHQTNGEFEEKFSLRNLDLISSLPEEPIIIEADGRHLWRVLENLYNNAFKYAMERSRVYVDITQSGDGVIFTIKNISENPLNIHGDELTERFVRGDVARTTEGSGLGLSIAKSLTELQKGQFEIYIDGDLFKVLVRFPVKSGEKQR